MGCISTKPSPSSPPPAYHVVNLTSTTYGVLDLSAKAPPPLPEEDKEISREWSSSVKRPPSPAKKMKPIPLKIPDKPQEVIDAWEIMAGLEDVAPVWSPLKKKKNPPRIWSPSPKKLNIRGTNKENSSPVVSARCSAERLRKPFNTWDGARIVAPPNSAVSKKTTPSSGSGARALRKMDPNVSSSSRRSLSPLFDPEMLAAIEREISQEKEQIKKMMVTDEAGVPAMLESFERKCPPGGEQAVVLYTTTLRGIRKTFEECNAVRSAVASHDVLVVERDVSMDSGYREELKAVLACKEVRVPALFVKGRFIGGAAGVLKLEEEGKLATLLEGMPRARLWCSGCAGARFVMCRRCNGSCKVLLDGERNSKTTVKCGDCNENGLIRCPICVPPAAAAAAAAAS